MGSLPHSTSRRRHCEMCLGVLAIVESRYRRMGPSLRQKAPAAAIPLAAAGGRPGALGKWLPADPTPFGRVNGIPVPSVSSTSCLIGHSRRSSDMDRRLLTAAALGAAIFFTTQAAGAQHRITQGPPPHNDNRSHPRFQRGSNAVAAFGDYELRSSYDDRDWAPESANDWWHDRPDRAFPRWVLEQQARGTCDPDRMWWSGSGWHC